MAYQGMKIMSALVVVLLAVALGTEGSRVLRDGCGCGEIYVVKDGETLQTISDRCNAPFILVDNPQIRDTDDVYAGLVLKLRSP
eukprot:Gb_36040 [translate_table: standard]